MNKKEKKKQAKRWETAAWDMLYLVQCSINGLVPDLDRVAKMDLAKVYARSVSQSLEAMTYMALESLMKAYPAEKITDETQVLDKWKEAKNKAIRKTILMDAARAELFAYLEEKGIWHVALKGAVLCHMYPEYGMRQMSDNDILFDPAFRQEVRDWFVERGYTVHSFEGSNHDEYQKKPVYNFEMHVSLFNEAFYPKFAQYYCGLKDRLIMTPDKKFEYNMSNEDFYLYILTHEYKHYSSNGIGLRFLVDLFVYHQARKSLHWEYLNAELEKLGLVAFEKMMHELSEKVFNIKKDAADLTKSEKRLLETLIFNNTYGSRKSFWYSHIKKAQETGQKASFKINVHYLMCWIFPDRTYMELWCQEYAPYIARHRWLMPVAPIWRIVKRGAEKRKLTKAKSNDVKKA